MNQPLHLHGVEHLGRPIDEVVDRLRRDASTLVDAATRTALAATSEDRVGFRMATEPGLDTRLEGDGMGLLRVSWNDDTGRWPPAGRFPFAVEPTSRWWHREEEETGWPTMVLLIVATPTVAGTRLAVWSTREPGVDVTTNRIDRHRRDRLARRAVEQFLPALAGLLAAVEDSPDRASVTSLPA
ncbi:hypothetical protein [Egicoccus sp. AB-alg6-2]|uniref:hypothetical protein n=1 Tax=Egicoccus sp. AB-alg6-2 TaxID=3242692 RepID=UPI00359E06C4